MITIVGFKWKKISTGFQLPGACKYTDEHVLIHKAMFERHLTIPHRYVCVTDEPVEGVECIPLWDKCKFLGGCYNRLYIFSEDMRELFGERFACVDLDCVIVNNVNSIFSRKEDFLMNSYKPIPNKQPPDPDQYYNGSLIMMDCGARKEVWESFDYEKSPEMTKNNPNTIGSDQAWIRHCLGKKEKLLTEIDGIYEARQIKGSLPDNAKIIFFSGNRDPSEKRYSWISKYYRR